MDDQSIITGLGIDPHVTLDEVDELFDFTKPQATSTVGNKKSRGDLTEEYLQILEMASEANTDAEFEHAESTACMAPLIKNVDGRVAVLARQGSSIFQGKSMKIDSCCHEGLLAIPMIDVEGMSGLSSSRLLIENTTISTGEVSRNETRPLKTYSVSESAVPERKVNRKSTSPDIIQACIVTDFPSYEDSNLSHGEVEDLSPDEGCYTDMEGKVEGLPPSLFEPQQSKLEMQSTVEHGRTSKLVSNYFENKDGTLQADKYKEDDVSNLKVHFDASQISAHSTTFGEGLEESKLLSTSCNSLGSLGEAVKEDYDDDFHEKSSGSYLKKDWFETEQSELISMFEGETFHEPDLEFFEEEEKKICKAYRFMGMEDVADSHLDVSCFSGIHGVAEITVRPSWIRSPDKMFVGPGNKMLIDDYLKSRSEALGSLDNCDDINRPCFGKAVCSPKMAKKPMPLLEMPLEESSMSVLYSQSDMGEAQEMESSEKDLECNRQSSSDSSGSNTYFNSEQSNTLSDKTLVLEISKEAHENPSSLIKADCSKDNMDTAAVNSTKELRNPLSITNKLLPKESRLHLEKSEDSHCIELLKMKKAKNLEETLNDLKGPINSERISSLLSEALESDNPRELIEKIMRMSQTSVLHETFDVTDLDMSSEVIELRKQREALLSKQARIDQRAQIGYDDKENIRTGCNKNNSSNTERKPFQLPQNVNAPKPVAFMPQRHMQKLKVSKTNSAPDNTLLTQGSTVKSDYSSVVFENTDTEESIRMLQYKSAILEDTQKLQLPNFHDDNRTGLDSSTPYAPRSVSGGATPGNVGYQIPMEKSRPVPSQTSQRTLPRMGVLSSSSKLPVPVNQSKGPSHLGTAPLIMAGTKNVSEMKGSVNIRNATSTQASTSQTSSSRVLSNIPVTPTTRSRSVPTGLQSMGMAFGPTQSLTTQPVNHMQMLKQYHSHENVAQGPAESSGKSELLSLPQQVVFPEVCVLGMASDTTVVFHNPRPRWVQVSLRVLQEKINGCSTATSALLFKPSYCVEPQNKCEIKLTVCSQFKGLLEAMLEVRASDLAMGSQASTSSHVYVQTILVHANISEPDVQIKCDGEDVLDFGVVPEGCTVSRVVNVVNRSSQSLPVILHLEQVAVTSPIFFWKANKNVSLRTVSPTHLACELPSASTESCPIPKTVTVTLKAPYLDNVKVDESGVVGVKSHMQVMLDTPDNSTVIISSFTLKACIGAVHLESLRTIRPLVLETISNDSCTTSVTLKNSSTFALRISLASREYQDKFTVHPDVMVIQPHSEASPNLVFTPKGREGRLESVLLMRVEPEGMEFELALAGLSHAPPPVPVLPGKLLALSEDTVTKSIIYNAPLPHMTEKTLSTALESTKSRLVFGTVDIEDMSCQKLPLRNNCTTQELSLVLGISGNKAFQIGEYGKKEGQSRMDVVLKPCQELTLSIFMCPKVVEPLSAALLCKNHSMANPFKCKIPLQGYGGKCKLEIPDSTDGRPLVLRDLAPGLPSILHPAFVNRGDRAMFLKLQVFTDENCADLIPPGNITVQPSEFVLAPKKSKEVFIIASGTSHILAKSPGSLGVLLVTYGDEILRRRFRRLKNKEVKIRRITDPSLLKINWGVSYAGEKDAQNEDDSLPPQPEDSTIFFNSCSKIQVQLYGERQADDEASSTMFACLKAEDTVNSIADITAFGNRVHEIHSPPVQGSIDCHSQKTMDDNLQPTVNTEFEKGNISWDVFPQSLSFPASDLSTHIFFVVNFSNIQQMFEATSDCRWLDVEPREAILPSLSSIKVCVKLLAFCMPHPITTPLTLSVKIMCENESRCASITVLPAGDGSVAPQITPPQQLQDSSAPSASLQNIGSIPKTSTTHLKHMKNAKNPRFDKQNMELQSGSAPTSVTTMGSSVTSTIQNQKSNDNIMTQIKNKVQLVSDNVDFPDTVPTKENYVKFQLRNIDSVIHSVKAEVIQGPFMVRHTHFRIKPGHYVSVPVYFRPQKTGTFSGHLKLIVMEDQEILAVKLYGRSVL